MIITKLKKLYYKIPRYKFLNLDDFYQIPEQEHLRKVLGRYAIDCVFDVGANYGQYALMLRKIGYKGRIISFEPNPDVAGKLRLTARGDDLWDVEEIALSSYDGEAVFNIMVDSQFSSLSIPKHDEVEFLESNKTHKTVKVRAVTLPTVFAELKKKYLFDAPFLKLDTQGFDVEIVKSAGPELNEFLGMQSELSIKKIYENSVDYRNAISLYEEKGFFLSALVPNNRGHFPVLVEIDCIMLRRGLEPLV